MVVNTRRRVRIFLAAAMAIGITVGAPINAVAHPAESAPESMLSNSAYPVSPGVQEAGTGATEPAPARDATASEEYPMVGATRGFNVHNLTASPLTFTGWDPSRSAPDSAPLVGAVLNPGDTHHFENPYSFFSTSRVDVRYKRNDTTPYVISMGIPSMTDKFINCAGGSGRCSVDKEGNAFLLDTDKTVLEISSGEGQKQSEVLNSLCDNDRAKCTFAPKRYEELVQSDQHGVGHVIQNNSTTPAMRMLTFTDSQSSNASWKVGAKVGVKLFDIASLEVSAEYGKSLTRSHSFSEQLTMTTPPGYVSWVTASQPVSRAHGDFTVTMGNTTWKLRDVYLEAPNPSGQGKWFIYDAPIHAPGSIDIPEVVTDTNSADSAAADTSTLAVPDSRSSIEVHHVGHEDIPSDVLQQILDAREQ